MEIMDWSLDLRDRFSFHSGRSGCFGAVCDKIYKRDICCADSNYLYRRHLHKISRGEVPIPLLDLNAFDSLVCGLY